MPNSEKNPKVDAFLEGCDAWHQEFMVLRDLVLDCGLTEELKWGVPCYTVNKGNVVLIHGFKEYCALLFVKGALLKDSAGVLVQQTDNVQAARQLRFKNVGEIEALKAVITEYVLEAAEAERAGREVAFKTSDEFKLSLELQAAFEADPALKAAFDKLTPGRQRAYLLYFSEPKQAKTRQARVDKYTPQILSGKGLYD